MLMSMLSYFRLKIQLPIQMLQNQRKIENKVSYNKYLFFEKLSNISLLVTKIIILMIHISEIESIHLSRTDQ